MLNFRSEIQIIDNAEPPLIKIRWLFKNKNNLKESREHFLPKNNKKPVDIINNHKKY